MEKFALKPGLTSDKEITYMFSQMQFFIFNIPDANVRWAIAESLYYVFDTCVKKLEAEMEQETKNAKIN